MSRPANPGAQEALLEAARAEIARAGLEGARVEDIARRAGLSKGAFYLHFRSKEHAFEVVLQRFMGVLEEHARRRHEAEERYEREAPVAPGPPDVARQLEFETALDADLLEIFWRNRLILAAVWDAGSSAFARLISDFRGRMRALVSARLRTRQQAGRLRADLDPDALATLVVGTFEGFGRRMVELREKPDLAAWARALVVVFYQGALDRGPRPSPDPLVTTGATR